MKAVAIKLFVAGRKSQDRYKRQAIVSSDDACFLWRPVDDRDTQTIARGTWGQITAQVHYIKSISLIIKKWNLRGAAGGGCGGGWMVPLVWCRRRYLAASGVWLRRTHTRRWALGKVLRRPEGSPDRHRAPLGSCTRGTEIWAQPHTLSLSLA